jgi:hypothetical protein
MTLFKRKLSDNEIKTLKENASYLEQFATNMFSARAQLKEKREASFNENTFINEFCREEYGRLNLFVNNRLTSTLKKANKLLKKYDIKEISIEEHKEVIEEEKCFEFFLLRYYLSLGNLKSPVKQLKIATIDGFDFYDYLNYFQIKSVGEKVQLLSYYYVSDQVEKENLNKMFENETKKNIVTKIEHIHNRYAVFKITEESYHSDGSQAGPYEFNFDIDNFKEVLNRIKNKENNVVSLKK